MKRWSIMIVDVPANLRSALHAFTAHAEDAISGLQSGVGRRRPGADVPNDNRITTVVRSEIQKPCGFSIFGMGRGPTAKANPLTTTIDNHRQTLIRGKQSVTIDRVPTWIFRTVKGDYAISGFESGFHRRASLYQVANNRRRRGRHSVKQRRGKRNTKGGQNIHHGTGNRN